MSAPGASDLTASSPGALPPVQAEGAEPSPAPNRCLRCGSTKLLGPAVLSVVGGSGVVLNLGDGTRAVVTATMCGECGFVHMAADGARMIWSALAERDS